MLNRGVNGKARFISVSGVTSAGTASTTENEMRWGLISPQGSIYYTKVPLWNNVSGGTISTGATGYNFISSDAFGTGIVNAIDTKSFYYNFEEGDYVIPSPYLGNELFYSDYIRTISGNNALSNLNGKGFPTTNTAQTASYACYHYSTYGTITGDWYLPAMGELAYMMVRWNTISKALVKIGGTPLKRMSGITWSYWSSTLSNSTSAYNLGTSAGAISSDNISINYFVRPFCQFQ